jgi:hypothetical protein
MTALMLAFAKDPPVIIGARHLDQATMALWLIVASVAIFFVLRPELWKRLWLTRVDPRGAALTRMALGITTIWTFVDLAVLGEFLFTDEGLYLTEMARKNYGAKLKTAWDPEYGFENFRGFLSVFESRWTILHVRSDPTFVWSIYAVMLASAVAMTLGWRTRITTILTWLLVNQIYDYSPIFYAGGDTVLRVMLFLGVFMRWGEAYSLDTWRRRRKAILGGATIVPALRKIPAWPLRLMMLQLSIIYCATGLLKSGGTWWAGTAMYYAMNLDHFYRVPASYVVTALHYAGVLPFLTWVVHWWEMLFPLALIGVALQAYVRERRAGTWPSAPRWRRWLSWSLFVHIWLAAAFVTSLGAKYYYKGRYIGLREDVLSNEQARWISFAIVLLLPVMGLAIYHGLRRRSPRGFDFLINWALGKRVWLGLGFCFHLGIEIAMNVGTFVQVMWSAYPVWLRGEEIDGFWCYLQSRPAKPGEASRPEQYPLPRKGKGEKKTKSNPRLSALRGAVHRRWSWVRYRLPRERYVVHHALDEQSVRRVALLRCWDLAHRLDFVPDEAAPAGRLCLSAPGGKHVKVQGNDAGKLLTRIFPGLWPLWPLGVIPGVGTIALRIVRQK